jgi:hypothetical protein
MKEWKIELSTSDVSVLQWDVSNVSVCLHMTLCRIRFVVFVSLAYPDTFSKFESF